MQLEETEDISEAKKYRKQRTIWGTQAFIISPTLSPISVRFGLPAINKPSLDLFFDLICFHQYRSIFLKNLMLAT